MPVFLRDFLSQLIVVETFQKRPFGIFLDFDRLSTDYHLTFVVTDSIDSPLCGNFNSAMGEGELAPSPSDGIDRPTLANQPRSEGPFRFTEKRLGASLFLVVAR